MLAAPLMAAGDPLLDGFDHLYNLSFDEAHQSFEGWEKSHPDDPRGPIFDAAAYLFTEFDRLRILQAQFFVDDSNFNGRRAITPDPVLKNKFEASLDRGERLAESSLRRSPNDRDALLASVTRFGLLADYHALIEKENFLALSETRQGRKMAGQLLRLYPDCYDAHLAAGVENYLLSQKPAAVRWLLRAGGAQADKMTGLAQLRITAEKGLYFKPYAELLLAIAALRDRQPGTARQLLASLAARFPQNALYREELAKIK